MKINWNYPKTDKHPEYSPWYVILWRLPFMMIAYVGLAIAWVGVLCAYCSVRDANRVWHI